MKNEKLDKYQDVVTNKVLVMFGGTVAFLWAISYLSRAFDYTRSFAAARSTAKILIYAGIAVVLAAIALQVYLQKKNLSKSSPVNGFMVAWVGLALSVSSYVMLYMNYVLAMRLLYIVMPVGAVLFLIYYTYQREFFTMALCHSVAAFSIWVMAKTSDNGGFDFIGMLAMIASVLMCITALALYFATAKSGGVLSVGNFKLAVFGPKTSKNAILAIYLLTIAAVICSFFIGAPVAYYIMFAICAFVFAAGVYYTAAMM